ncbi:Gfo/Idh/MocA family protein [Paenibacillus sp. PAMC21692]|uniref:Gfo/Idh/MocA family protein n=1 Tax=Paenibacillus sp. PAMC21692 TaxID=2762320 RepID=UPI00164D2050|nr:Gfo/Idh/MocA family oxidoreductase [Paenibacillus sp. PAMC21692]QNK58956.1 Gfo/Idh/MocA family oxidoreductase [Paenibacillus sp. PAMC21692]
MRVALVGAGGMGRHHLNVYKQMNDVEVVAVVDADLDNARTYIASDAITFYADLEDMLASEHVDMVDICTPTFLHAQQVMKVMEHGIHVLCEKPIALHPGEAKQVIECAAEYQVQFMVAHVIRFWPEYVYLKQVFEERRYGKLKQLQLSRISSIPQWSWQDWMMKGEQSGGSALDLHIHDTDFILHLLGTPKSVTSVGIKEGRTLDYISTVYEYDHMLVQAEGGWYKSPLPFSMSFKACFEQAILEYKNGNLSVYAENEQTIEVSFQEKAKSSSESSGINIDLADGYFNEIEYFLDCIREGKRPERSLPESSLESLTIVYKELESLETRRKVKY